MSASPALLQPDTKGGAAGERRLMHDLSMEERHASMSTASGMLPGDLNNDFENLSQALGVRQGQAGALARGDSGSSPTPASARAPEEASWSQHGCGARSAWHSAVPACWGWGWEIMRRTQCCAAPVLMHAGPCCSAAHGCLGGGCDSVCSSGLLRKGPQVVAAFEGPVAGCSGAENMELLDTRDSSMHMYSGSFKRPREPRAQLLRKVFDPGLAAIRELPDRLPPVLRWLTACLYWLLLPIWWPLQVGLEQGSVWVAQHQQSIRMFQLPAPFPCSKFDTVSACPTRSSVCACKLPA